MKPASLGGTGSSSWFRQLEILSWINDGAEIFLFQYSVHSRPCSNKLKFPRE